MTAMGINAAASLSRAGSFVSVTFSQVRVSDSSFGNVLNDKVNAAGKDKPVNPAAADKPKADSDILKTTEYSTEQAESAKQEGSPINGAANTEPVNSTEEQDFDKDPEELARAAEILNTILVGIADILNTSLRELEGAFEKLQMQPVQLLDTGKLAGLIMNFSGMNDMSEMLVNDSLYDTLGQLEELVSSVLEEFGVTGEEFAQLVTDESFVQNMSFDEESRITVLLSESGITLKADTEDYSETTVDTGNASEDLSEENAGETGNVTSDTFGTVKKHENNSEPKENRNGEPDKADITEQTEKKDSSLIKQLTPEGFAENVEKAMKNLDIDMPVTEGVTVRDIVYQLVDAVKAELSPDNTSIELKLTPESLGKVSVNVTSKDGVMTAQITTENQVAKEALESQLVMLKENIEQQGVRVEAIEVTVESFNFSDSKNSDSRAREQIEESDRRRSRIGSISMGDLESYVPEGEAERLEKEVMLQNGSTVNYVA